MSFPSGQAGLIVLIRLELSGSPTTNKGIPSTFKATNWSRVLPRHKLPWTPMSWWFHCPFEQVLNIRKQLVPYRPD